MRVSVYIPTRNRVAKLAESVLSVLAQSHVDLEIIVVDDASEDATPELLADLQRSDSRLRHIRFEERRGPSAARNAAIAEARGEFVTGLDDDDLMLPNRVATLLQSFNPQYAFTCSSIVLQKSDGRRKILHGKPGIITLDQLLYYNAVGNQVFTLTHRIREIGGFDEDMAGFEDYDLWIRLTKRFGPASRISAATYIKREHDRSAQLTWADSFVEGARRFRYKHNSLLNPAQRHSQLMLERLSASQSLSLVDLCRAIRYPSFHTFVRYAVNHAWKILRRAPEKTS